MFQKFNCTFYFALNLIIDNLIIKNQSQKLSDFETDFTYRKLLLMSILLIF
jgi:hypothetical protein